MPRSPTPGLAVCGGVLLLLTVSVCAAADAHNVPLHGVDVQGVGKGARRGDSATPVGTTPHAGTPSAGPATQVELADPALASTAAKREQLTYLVRCALSEDVTLYTQQGPERFTFQGRLGLAPRWLYEAMTPSEERWISACLLAHVNYFGTSVPISLRAQPPVVPTLAVSDEEHQNFSIFEGGFFGNLFLPTPVAYTCRGDRTLDQARDPILQTRVCTQETGTTTAGGTPMTFCHLLMTGRCEDAASFTVDGTYYTEVIFTYLRPSAPSGEQGAPGE